MDLLISITMGAFLVAVTLALLFAIGVLIYMGIKFGIDLIDECEATYEAQQKIRRNMKIIEEYEAKSKETEG